MIHVVLGLGSNTNRNHHITMGLSAITDQYGKVDVSPVYETEAVGFSGPPFYNLVIGFHTTHAPAHIQQTMHAIEADAGRVRGANKNYDDRSLDIDLLLYGNRVLHPQFNVPRDEVEQHAFVLKPLSDLYPDLRHPVSGRSFLEMWQSYDRSHCNLTRVELDYCFPEPQASGPYAFTS